MWDWPLRSAGEINAGRFWSDRLCLAITHDIRDGLRDGDQHMIQLVLEWAGLFLSTLMDVLPIAVILFGFQYLVIRRPIPNLRRVLFGFGYVLLGLTFFLMGLEKALFPLGKLMARQLTDPVFLAGCVFRQTGY